jgi:hypothetical protein
MLDDFLNSQSCYVCDQVRAGGSADLVCDDTESFPVLGQTQHGLGKIVTASTVNPTGAKDQVLAARSGNGLLAG